MTDFDPTTNRIQFGMLSEDEQTALIHWPHGWEIWWGYEESDWGKIVDPFWDKATVYRGKPAPVVTSKWFNVYPRGPSLQAYPTRKRADDIAGVDRIVVMRIDTCNGVSTAHLEEI